MPHRTYRAIFGNVSHEERCELKQWKGNHGDNGGSCLGALNDQASYVLTIAFRSCTAFQSEWRKAGVACTANNNLN